MGMDVNGLNPQDKSGEYFRASIWQWPSVLAAIEATGTEVPIEWTVNDGHGYKTQEECTELANKLDKLLAKQPILPVQELPVAKEVEDIISQMNNVDPHETFDIDPDDKSPEIKREVELLDGTKIQIIRLSKDEAIKQGYINAETLQATEKTGANDAGLEGTPAIANLAEVERFSKFLRSCGGFEIF